MTQEWYLAAGKALYKPVVFTKTVPGLLLGFDRPLGSVPSTAGSSSAHHIPHDSSISDAEDARICMAAGNFKRPMLRHVSRIVIISSDIEFTPFGPFAHVGPAGLVRACQTDWDAARSILASPLLPACFPNLLGVRIGNVDPSLSFRGFWQRNAWAKWEPKDRGRLLLHALAPRFWCEAQSGFIYSLPCPTRVTDYEAVPRRLPEYYTYHATTAEPFRVLWGTRNKIVYTQDAESDGPRGPGEPWSSDEAILDNISARLFALFPPWADATTTRQLIKDTSFDFIGVARNWHWTVELLVTYHDEGIATSGDGVSIADLNVPKTPAEWAALADRAKEAERASCAFVERGLRERLRARYGGKKEEWEEKVKVYDTTKHHEDANCPSCGAEWNHGLEQFMRTIHDDRHGHECSEECCLELDYLNQAQELTLPMAP